MCSLEQAEDVQSWPGIIDVHHLQGFTYLYCCILACMLRMDSAGLPQEVAKPGHSARQ